MVPSIVVVAAYAQRPTIGKWSLTVEQKLDLPPEK
jgi:hypothetical protein